MFINRKNENTYDFVIIGNGILGLFSSIKLKCEYPSKSVLLIGPKNQYLSASKAAGAMLNVYGEIGKWNKVVHKHEIKCLELGIRGSELWNKFFIENGIANVVRANNTYVYLKKYPSTFEEENFNQMSEIAKSDKVLEEINEKKFKNKFHLKEKKFEAIIKLKNERSICTDLLFQNLFKIAKKKKIEILNERVESIISEQMMISLENHSKIYSRKIIVSAGSMTAKLFERDTILPMFQGVGTAVSIKSNNSLNRFKNNVIRTVNRGGAQCGLHIVPRSNNEFYLGAGNYITLPGPADHRIETVRYLFNSIEKDLIDQALAYQLTGRFLIGCRPKSIDSFPMIGSLANNSNIFIATGTNRSGLTWSPAIAEQIICWAKNKPISDLFDGWNPDRDPISYGTKDEAIDYFVNSRLSAALEHHLIPGKNSKIIEKNDELFLKANQLLRTINQKYVNDNTIFHPDHWSILAKDDSGFSN